MRNPRKRFALLAIVPLATVGALAACSPAGSGSDSTDGGGSADAIKIGLLLPETKTARYEAFDRPLFEDKLTSLGDYDIVYANADQDASKQQQQAESALTEGVKVLVLDPVDGAAAASIAEAAAAQDVPVISYDRLIKSDKVDYYISFDNEQVGVLQGTALVDKLQADGTTTGIIMINGSPTDANAADFKKGAHSVIDPSGIPVLAEYDTPDWSPDKAQEWAAGQVTQFGTEISGVYAANDGTAGGAVAAMKAAGTDPWPPVTGQDAELAGIQRIVAGDQFMTVYKAIKLEAELAAEVADQLAQGETPEPDTTFQDIPSTLLTPVVVTIDNIQETVIDDGFYTVDQICTDTYADACAAAGLQ
ncbi:sugar ABC transporter substrate-binding protein [Cryobacterium sp.]|jgi:D-xylose transport system substrate-binding protein|uniref:sugar ABC transporter substrate-binding protein n=1 Tax=Cryobacterium sp. TaxID=1926290 RepID=UPI00261D1070|nr:sugar ABC transporter substrate-binding protein [Cryobacterium sp.]MCU1445445.1 transporter substrate-binding protein [Cryobacterium sp.]